VKSDDIMRIYRKQGRRIDFKGKVKVVKVAQNYSAVELIKSNGRTRLEIGDVGFRDRNFLMTGLKRVRIWLGKLFSGLAKGFAYAAKNFEVQTEEPELDFEISDLEVKKVDLQTLAKKKPAAKKIKREHAHAEKLPEKPNPELRSNFPFGSYPFFDEE